MLPVTADHYIITSNVLIWHVAGLHVGCFFDGLIPPPPPPPNMCILHLGGFPRSPVLSGMKISIVTAELQCFCVYSDTHQCITTQCNLQMNRYLGMSKISIISKDFLAGSSTLPVSIRVLLTHGPGSRY